MCKFKFKVFVLLLHHANVQMHLVLLVFLYVFAFPRSNRSSPSARTKSTASNSTEFAPASCHHLVESAYPLLGYLQANCGLIIINTHSLTILSVDIVDSIKLGV